MKFVVSIICGLFLTGCVCQGKPKEVLVPLATPIAEPPVIEQPYLPIWLLTDQDDENPDKGVRYYAQSLYMQRLHSQKLQCALDAYRIETPKQCPDKLEEK